MGTSMYF